VNSSTASTSIDKRVATLETAEIPDTIIDAKGDLIVGSAADTAARQAVGANGTVLTARSTAANGVAWETPASGGASIGLVVALS
jgi:lipoprotein-anchoring transpeptidase ErfK/SrfK